MEVVLNIPDPEYASMLYTEAIIDIFKNMIDKYAKDNSLTNEEKTFVYMHCLEHYINKTGKADI